MSDRSPQKMGRKRCRDIMTSDVTTAERQMPLYVVAGLMRKADIGSLPVVDDGKLIGIITDRDIVVRGVAEQLGDAAAAEQVMTAEVFSVSPDDFVFQAIKLMGEQKIRRLPVVDADGRLAGIIAMADIALETEDERDIAEALEEISSGSGFWGRK